MLRNDSFHDNSFRNLSKLNLSYNQISVLHEGTLSYLTRLTYLYLSSNSLHTIYEGAFSTLKSLILLDLNNNLLTNISALVGTSFQHATHAKSTLDLSSNMLQRIDSADFDAFARCPTTLDLRRNKIAHIEGFGSRCPVHLDWLYLELNELTYINNSFRGLMLTDLSLMYNRIKTVHMEPNEFSATNLLLDHNQINDLSFLKRFLRNELMFSGHLGLSYNNLSKIEPDILKLLKRHNNFDIQKCVCF